MRATALHVVAVVCLSAHAMAQQAPVRISLWANGAPGSEARRAEPEEARAAQFPR